ncbi:MAG: AraC family transcriptional regulator [Bacteroidota bacterium]
MLLPDTFYKDRKLDTLVENKTSYTLNKAEVHVYETHQQAERVLLQFDYPVLASMIQGKKVMHLKDHESFPFFPGESLILPANQLMAIDFPEASEKNPTRCLAMTISEDKLGETLQMMNEMMPKADGKEWSMMDYNFHFTNDSGIYQILQRLLFLFSENHSMKDVFVDNMLNELIIRILQANSFRIYQNQSKTLSSTHRLAYVMQYIKDNLDKSLTIEELSEQACMSKSHFYRVFKDELGLSPVDYINRERIKLATRLMKDRSRNIKEVYLACGFESRSYFNRVFKKIQKVTPKKFLSSDL